MEAKKFANTYVLRIDKGEEVVETIKKFCKKEAITLGSISGLGATNNATIGLFDIAKKQYFSRTLSEDLEITALVGNISQKDGEVYLHLHATLADKNQNCFGGHLNSCVISATGEIIITSIEGIVGRKFDEDTGLNLMDF